MATLPAPGAQLSVSQINALKSVANANTNITTREQQYMGGNPARPSTSGVCMPNDVLDSPWYDPIANPSGRAQTKGTDWTYTGPGVGGAWSPTSFSEFGGAYNNPPQVSITSTGFNCGWSTSCRTQADVVIAFSNGTPNYYYAYQHNSGGAPTFPSGWTGTTAGPISFRATGLSTPTAYLWAAVRDSLNCGTGYDLRAVTTYP